jgi:hypothetical protein
MVSMPRANTIIVALAEVGLIIFVIVPGGDQSLKDAAIGAMIGLASGHLNGTVQQLNRPSSDV